MAWQGEEQIKEYFGFRGFKCLVILLLDEINALRQAAGLPDRTLPQTITAMDNLMEENKSDDDGPEPV